MLERRLLPWIVPFAMYIAFIAIADGLGRLGVDPATLRYLYPVKIALVLTALLYYRRSYIELGRPIDSRSAALAVAAGLVVLVLWLNLDAGWMVVGRSDGYDPRDNGVINWPLAAVRLFGASFVVPIMEELFWRSFLMRWLDHPDFLKQHPRNGKWLNVALVVILFAVEHNQWLAGAVAGLVYAMLYRSKGNLWSPVIAHMITNVSLSTWILCTGRWTYW